MDNESPIDPGAVRLVIRKNDRKLEMYDGDAKVRTYPIVLGFCAEGDKEVEGDGKTPEGDFYVFTKNRESRFHLSLGLSYPSSEDAERGLSGGLISKDEHDMIAGAIGAGSKPPQKTVLGGEIYIHGGGTAKDWTDGCVALNNDDIREIFDLVPTGTMVTIVK